MPSRPVDRPRRPPGAPTSSTSPPTRAAAWWPGRTDLAGVPLVLSIGSTMPDQRELDGTVLAEADVLVIDTPDLLEESGDALDAAVQGLDRARVQLLGEYVDSPSGRTGTTVYKSIGSPEQDLVLAKAIVDHLSAQQVPGRVIDSLTDIKRNL